MSDPSAGDPGFSIPGYTDVRLIGRGGFSTVYYAVQTQFERVVALKVLDVGLEDERTRRQYQRECAATGRLSGHPNIVSIIDSGFTSKQMPYLSMDYFSQGSLADRVGAFGPLPVHEVLRIGVKISGALESAHQKDILHRDIKPENILVSGYGEPGLADFGIATVTARLQSSVTIHALTPNHAPPEVMEGKKATEVSDVYSLGSTLYELLAGRPAFNLGNDNSILAFLVRVMQEPVPPIPRQDVVPVVFDVLLGMMAKDPAARYQSAGAVGVALQQLQAHLGYPVTELVTFAPVPGVLAAGGANPTAGGPMAAPVPVVGAVPPAAAPPTAMPDPAFGTPATGIPPAAAETVAPQTYVDPAAASVPPAPTPYPVAPPAAGVDASSYALGGDATVARPAALGGPEAVATAGAAPAPAPSAGAVAPPPPPSAGAWGEADGSATVLHGRHSPAIEAADLSPVPIEAGGPPKALRVVAIVIGLLLLAGAGFAGWKRLSSPSTSASTDTGPSTTVAGGADPSTSTPASSGSSPGDLPDLPTSVETTPGTVDPATVGPPTDVKIEVTTSDSVQVTWRDASGGKLPHAYQVLSTKGEPLSKISALAPGQNQVVVTKTDSGPLKTAVEQYCVAVGTIAGAGKPLWAEAPCTDGTTVEVT